jgi:phospholipase/carboxylesterase
VVRTPRTHQDGRLRSRPRPDADRPLPAGLHDLAAVGLPDHLLLVPPVPAEPGRLVVWFHGAGGSARASAPVLEQVATASGASVLLPSSLASTWDLLTGRTGDDVARLDAALAHVLAATAVTSCAFAGFSDGGSYALSLGLANGDLAEAVLAFSPGFLAPPAVVGRPRCFVAHGTADTVLPVDRCGRRVVALLQREGYPVRYEEFAGGHVVRPDLLDLSFSWWLDGGPAA